MPRLDPDTWAQVTLPSSWGFRHRQRLLPCLLPLLVMRLECCCTAWAVFTDDLKIQGTLQWLFCFLGLVQVWTVIVARDPHHRTFLAVSLPKKAQTCKLALGKQWFSSLRVQPSCTGASGKALQGIRTLYSLEAFCINTCHEAHSPDHQENQEGDKEALMILLDTKKRGDTIGSVTWDLIRSQ